MYGQRRTIVLPAALLLCLAAGGISPRRLGAEPAGPARWAFRARSPVHLDTPIIRLGDVVEPVGPAARAWPRLRRATIGLLPLDATPMILRRDRLARAVRSAEGVSQEIQWLGPQEIEVIYRPAQGAGPRTTSPGPAPSGVSTTSMRSPQESVSPNDSSHGVTAGTPAGRPSPRHASSRPRLEPAAAERLAVWIESAVRREHPEAAERFGIAIDPAQAALAPLESAQGIQRVSFVTPPREGTVALNVAARGGDKRSSTTIEVHLTPYPKVAVATDRFRRGDRLAAGDVQLRPWPKDQTDDALVTDVESLVGMEVRRPLSPDRPISRGDVGPPILVHRGDRVQVRVVGRGIKITTEATAKDDAAQGEVVEVQTLRPRKKLLTRVVGSGLVEIITRAPQVPR